MSVSARSRLTAGVFAAAAGIALVAPVAVPPTAVPSLTAIASPAIQLSAALTPLAPIAQIAQIAQPVGSAASSAAAVGQTPGDWIINAYFTVQPWVEYGVEVFAWATEWLPWPIGLLAPQADIIYSGWQPFAESVAFALAYLVDGQFDLVLPTLTFGIQTGISTFIQNEIAWIASFFPPLPPIGFAAAAPVAAGVGAAAATRAPALTGDAAEAVVETTATTTATPETGIESVAAQTDTAEAAAVSAQADAENVPSAAAATASEALAEVTTAAPPEVTAAAPVEVAAAAPVEVTAAEPAVADVAPAPRAVRHSGRAPTQSPAVTSVREAPAAAAATAASSAADSAEPKSRVSARGGRAG